MKPIKSQWYTFYNELSIKLTTDNPDFLQFVEKAFGFLKTESSDDNPDLDIQVYFHKKNTVSLPKKLGYDLFFDEGEILHHDRGFSVHAKQGKPLSITAHVQGIDIRDVYYAFRYGIQGTKKGKYLEIMRKSLHMPIFYLLEKKGYTLLHGSAVVNGNSDKTYIFLGANYVGKTTTVLNLINNKEHDFGLIGDNYILIKDNKIYPFPDAMRVSKNSLDMLDIKTKKQAVSGKYLIDMQVKKILVPWPVVGKAFFMQLGPESEIKPIDFSTALNRLNASHSYLGEFPEHSYLAFFSDFPSVQILQARVANFLKSQELFVFQRGPNVKENTELLLKNIT